MKSAHLKTSNRQRTTILELVPASENNQLQCLLFPSQSEVDIKPWFAVVDNALKNFPTESDSLEPSLSEAINEAVSNSVSGEF